MTIQISLYHLIMILLAVAPLAFYLGVLTNRVSSIERDLKEIKKKEEEKMRILSKLEKNMERVLTKLEIGE